MKTPNAVRSSSFLFNGLMFVAGFSFMLVLLPLLRCLFDGETYSWGMQIYGISFFSRGIQADYFILIPLLSFYLLFYYSFYWLKNRSLFYVVLIVWWLLNFGNLLFDIFKNGDTMFHGDTLNIHISLTKIIVPFSIITLGWIIWIILKDKNLPIVNIPWAKRNKKFFIALISLLPIQAVLLATGEPHALTDEIGVVLIIIQSFLIALVFIPKKLKAVNS
jgi:hypothetical protein